MKAGFCAACISRGEAGTLGCWFMERILSSTAKAAGETAEAVAPSTLVAG